MFDKFNESILNVMLGDTYLGIVLDTELSDDKDI